LADLIRYHVNVQWEKAPDYRTSRTLDWLNDACEAKLKNEDRDHGEITYMALMSPASVGFICRGTALSFDWRHPFAQANRAKLRLGKRRYTRGFPISLLLTTERTTKDDGGEVKQIHPYVLLGTKQWLGRFATVKRYKPTGICCYAVREVEATPRHPVRRVTAAFRHPVRLLTVIRRRLTERVIAAFRRPAPQVAAPPAHPVPEVAAAPRDPARQMADRFQCMLRTGTIYLDIRFPTEYEANVLVDYLKSKSEVKSGLAFMYPKGRSPIGGQPI
jgi:hypothetical protein